MKNVSKLILASAAMIVFSVSAKAQTQDEKKTH